MYDVVIIGAGPAGSTLARMLDKKYKVLLIDQRDSASDVREKPCGGLLAPDAQGMLAQLGLGIPRDILVGPQVFGVKTIDFDNSLERYYQRHYLNISRDKFDKWLSSLIPRNVEFECSCIYKSHSILGDDIEVCLRKNDSESFIKTKILVGADGPMSRVREQVFKNSTLPDKYVSIQNWYKTDGKIPYYISVFDKEVTDFYSWIIQKENYLLIGSAIPHCGDANAKFSLLLEKLKRYGFQIGDLHKKTGSLIMRTRKLQQINTAKEKIALVGEAAGFISPSSAEGISYALLSASYLAKSINKNYDNFRHEYAKQARKIKRNIFMKNIKIPFMYNSFIRKLIMKSGILSMKVIDSEEQR